MSFRSLTARLREHAVRWPDKAAFTFLANGESEQERLTFRELDERVDTLAARLAIDHAPGERALLLYPAGLEFVVAFLACLRARIVPVPAALPKPNRRESALARVRAIAADCRPVVVLTTEPTRQRLAVAAGEFPKSTAWLSTDTVVASGAPAIEPTLEARALAFLQYTSGSSGTPKGVRVGHGNLVHNLETIAIALGNDASSCCVAWLPVFHDMGLVGIVLESVYVGNSCVLMSPEAFLQRPARWLEAITRYRGTYNAAPNFAYDACVDRTPEEARGGLDLSSWRVACSGAEPVRAATLDRFTRAFAPYGFRRRTFLPCYGLAEATLFATGIDGTAEPTVREIDATALERGHVVPATGGRPLVACGSAWQGQQVAIVDPETRRRCAPDRVGEIWISGDSVAQGYWDRPEQSAETFEARIADENGARAYLRTGDLGFLHDGELYVAGRLKDLVIVRGRNVYPEDVEACVDRCHERVVPGFAAGFALETERGEELGVAVEVHRYTKGPEADAVIGAIRRAVTEDFDVTPAAIALLERGALPRTTSGKVQRRACREAFREGALREVARWVDTSPPPPPETNPTLGRSKPEIEAWIVGRLATRIGQAPEVVDPRAPFADYGLDSRILVETAGELASWLGSGVEPHLLYSYPTPESLARHLGAESTRERIHITRTASEPIAIVGAGCRLPGGADSPEAFWELLRAAADVTTETPPDRWNLDELYDPDPAAPGRIYSRRGGYVEGLDRFDPAFFGISPREAASLDPQQRMLLEVSWEALERAGVAPDRLEATRTGVFLGISGHDNADRLLAPERRTGIDMYTGTGTAISIAAGRLAYQLGLRGPCISVDTACSSSLVALHLAAQSLRDRECSLALVAGVQALYSPELMMAMCRLRALSASGRCRPFAAEADGYLRSEGCGVFVLKRLGDAERDGDSVWAVIRGSAVNQDGRSNGLTAPSAIAQEEVIVDALARAGLAPADVDFVECHGTGTSIGDPIEVAALAAAYGPNRDAMRPLVLGAVKANVGHLEPAAAMAALLKVVLALRHEQIPAQPPMDALNPQIAWEALPMRVAREATAWSRGARPRRAGINAFGISGTNAHLIVEEAPAATMPADAIVASDAELVALSARDPRALADVAARWRDHLDAHPDDALADVAFSSWTTRASLPERLAVRATSRAELRAALDVAARSETPAHAARGRVPTAGVPKIAFVFPGQGSQWPGMGRRLREQAPTFRDALARCDAAIHAEAGFSVVDAMEAPEAAAALVDIDVVQPALFAMSVALAALFRSWGVEPHAVVGHSLGEVAAACVAGALSLEDGARVICRRSRLLRRIRGQGDMAVVELTLAEAEAAIEADRDRLGVAASNGPRSTVLSGDPQAIARVLADLEARGIFCRRVKVDVASHSPQVDPLLGELVHALDGITPRDGTLRLQSTARGTVLSGRELTAAYWAENLRHPVRFAEAIDGLLSSGHGLFLELSPHPLLLVSIEEMRRAADRSGAAIGSLRRGEDGRAVMLESLAALTVHGVRPNLGTLFPAGGRRVSLPTYPWQRERHWIDAVGEMNARDVRRPGDHPLLGAPSSLSTRPDTHFWTNTLRLADMPWLAHHRVNDAIVLPAAAFVEMAWAAAAPHAAVELREITFPEALILREGTSVPLQIVAVDEGPTRRRVTLSSGSEGDWVAHARGLATAAATVESGENLDVEAIRRRMTAVPPEQAYETLARAGLSYGPAFRGIGELWRGQAEALARVELPPAGGVPAAYQIHPALLDACLQTAAFAENETIDAAWVPMSMASLSAHSAVPPRVWCHARATATSGEPDHRRFNFSIATDSGDTLLEISGLLLRRLDIAKRRPEDDWRVSMEWTTSTRTSPRAEPGRWRIVDESGGMAGALGIALAAAGHKVQQPSDRLPPTAVVYLSCGVVEEAATLDAALRRYDGALALVQAMLTSSTRDTPRLFLVTRGAQAAGDGAPVDVSAASLLGFRRVVALEHPEIRATSIDLDPRADADVAALAAELLSGGDEDEIALRGSERRVARLVRPGPGLAAERTSPAEGRPFRLSSARPGLLDSLAFRPLERRTPNRDEVEIAVEAASLNFVDVMAALGKLPGADGGSALGAECAGVVVAVGDDVTGIAVGSPVVALAAGSLGTHVTTDARLVVPRPACLSAAEAAALPSVYMTAWYALVETARLRRAERVLIHSATGGTGLAAIAIAREIGAEIFATAGSPEKREWLRAMGIEHVMDSRSLAFADECRVRTGGTGVDVVLNSLAGPAVEAGLRSLAPEGRFIEIGKTDIYSDRALGLGVFRPGLSYASVDLAGLARLRPDRLAALFQDVLGRIATGALPPLPIETRPMSQAPEAIRTMARAQHRGKLVLTLPDPDAIVNVPEGGAAIREHATYLITGGLGALGLRTAFWLLDRGARHLILIGRRGAATESQRDAVRLLEAKGASVEVAAIDVADMQAVLGCVRRIPADRPLRGVVHAAGVLDDALLLEQTPARLRPIFAAKAAGAWNLDEATRGETLDFFVSYSSIAGLLGSPGQANYAAASTFVDALTHRRRAAGRAALAVDWGTFAEAGLAAEDAVRGARLEQRGLRALTADEGLGVLGQLMEDGVTQVGVLPIDLRQWVEFYPSTASSPRLASLLAAGSGARPSSGDTGLRAELAAASTPQRVAKLEQLLSEQLSRVLRLGPDRLDRDAPFASLGMDSLTGLEMRNRLEVALGLRLRATLLWNHPTIAALAAHLASELAVTATETAPTAAPPVMPSEAPEATRSDLDDAQLLALVDEELSRARGDLRP
jgi:acyl transferase domain-containing protein/acyl-CoA synthetase (AMP-forming)/AMP-acid ligase II/NADPH:quinone reductase-like Zn-dependent oxidoreductase/acyl carrier protein/NADP-dependent 3-hydroxy acid dehydrogenase YdfG